MTVFSLRVLCSLALLPLVLGGVSCRHGEIEIRRALAAHGPDGDPLARGGVSPEAERKSSLYEWNGAGMSGPVEVTIDLGEQKARISRGGQAAGWTYVAAGVSGRPTPTGSFRITEKVRDKHSTSWGRIVDSDGDTVVHDAKSGRDRVPSGGRFAGAPMPFWMRINGAIGMHAGPIPHPGSPASHGCIRLPREMAEILFGVTEVGTPVRVVR